MVDIHSRVVVFFFIVSKRFLKSRKAATNIDLTDGDREYFYRVNLKESIDLPLPLLQTATPCVKVGKAKHHSGIASSVWDLGIG